MLSESVIPGDRPKTLFWAQTLIEAMPQLVWTASPEGPCEYLSRQWIDFTGVPESEQLGDGWLNVLHPEDRERAAHAWSDAAAGRADYDLEYRIRRHDGVYRWFKTRGVPQFGPDGSLVRWLGTSTDIDDQKSAEERFSGLLKNISDAVFIIDLRWRYIFVNRPAAAFANVTPAEMAGRTVWDVFPAEKGSRFEREATRAFQTANEARYESFNAESNRWHQTDIFPHRDNIIVFVRDITARRLMDQELQQADKQDSLAVLAGGVAHDFNNLLVGIMGNVSLSLDMLPDSSPVRVMLEDAIIASERAALLTRQLLAYAGKGQFILERLDISALVRDTRQLVRAKIPSHVDLRLILDDNLPPVQGDVSQIQQVIMNLIINAAEAFEPSRPGQVRVFTQSCRLPEAEELPSGLYVSLKVEDEGNGMSPEVAARVFEPFFTTKFTGRGLGLAAVQGIIHGHRGRIRMDSTLGKGSTFTILLPAMPPG